MFADLCSIYNIVLIIFFFITDHPETSWIKTTVIQQLAPNPQCWQSQLSLFGQFFCRSPLGSLSQLVISRRLLVQERLTPESSSWSYQLEPLPLGLLSLSRLMLLLFFFLTVLLGQSCMKVRAEGGRQLKVLNLKYRNYQILIVKLSHKTNPISRGYRNWLYFLTRRLTKSQFKSVSYRNWRNL